MAYKYSKGKTFQGDIYNQDDTEKNTYLDWDEDYIGLVTSGSAVLVVSGSKVGIGTTTPSGALEIKHAEKATMQFSSDAYRQYTIGSDGYGFIIHDETVGDTSGYRFVISDQADYLGYVGIGDGVSIAASAHPKALLHLSSSDDQALFRIDTTGGDNATTVLFATGSGRVGIGTSSPSHTLEVAGTMGVNEYIYHNGDDDTYIQFSDDEIVLYAGGRGFLKCQEDTTDKLMVNYGALDIDLQVKGENEANLIRTDAANDLVGIGTAEPSARLSVSGSEFSGLAIAVTDDHTNYFQISGSQQGSVTAFGFTADKAAQDNPDVSFFVSGAVGGKGNYGVTVINGDLQVSGNIYNTLGDGKTTHLSPYLAQQILDPSSATVFTITNSSNTLYKVDWDSGDTSCTDPHVTFTAPPSGQVLVDVHVYLDDTSTSGAGPYIYLALSTSTAANISSTDGTIVGKEKIIWYPDEADDGVRTMTFYATGLTAGTSYTWNLFARRYNDGETNRVICGAQYPAMIMQVRPVMDNADIYSS